MPDSTKSQDNQIFQQYMLNELQFSIDNSKRMEERSSKAIDLFLALFTALSGAGIIAFTTVNDMFQLSSTIAFIAILITGLSFITYVWLLYSSVSIQEERIVRYYLHKYFQDMAPETSHKYGRTMVLDFYRHQLEEGANLDFARFASLSSLIILSGLSLGVAIYEGWSAITGHADVWISAAAGTIWIAMLTTMGIMAWRRLEKRKAKRRKQMLEHAENLQSTDSVSPAAVQQARAADRLDRGDFGGRKR